MAMLVYLIPISLGLGGLGLAAFFWALRHHQYDDPAGASQRILLPDFEDAPMPGTPPPDAVQSSTGGIPARTP